MSLNRKIVVIATGGTIAGVASSPSDHTGYLAGQLDISHLVAAIPGLADPACSLQLEQLAQLDSKDMDAAFRKWGGGQRPPRVRLQQTARGACGIIGVHDTVQAGLSGDGGGQGML